MNILDSIREKVKLRESIVVLEKVLLEIYLFQITSTKGLARKVLLPVPLIAAIKNELVKAGILKRDRHISLTQQGEELINRQLGFGGVDKSLFIRLLEGSCNLEEELGDLYATLVDLLTKSPGVDVTLDQSKATIDTVLSRACLALATGSLIGKQVLCLGDDDLVSIGAGFLLKRLFNYGHITGRITVVDIDSRFLDYINAIAVKYDLPVSCCTHDLRNPLPGGCRGRYDTVFTDPPYTLPGLELFLSRAVEGLRKQQDLVVFLSFAHKPGDFLVKMYRQILNLGLVPVDIRSDFNRYEGAEIIGNLSQMIVLKTTSCRPQMTGSFKGPLYTGEIRRTRRLYLCKSCKKSIPVGIEEQFPTIEQLKKRSCPDCGGDRFELINRQPR